MSRYWSPIVRQLDPYVPGEQPKERLVKLNTNENPYPPSPATLAALAGEATESLRLYPDPNCDELKRTIAEVFELEPEMVFVGNGSDEILAHTFQGLLQHETPLLMPDISYSFYPVYCGLYQVQHKLIPLTEDFRIDVKEYCGENGGILLANPNAPTGRSLELEEIRYLLDQNMDSVVVVDEAYVDFGGQTAASLIREYPNLLVIQTLSKSRSLAGLRVGFAMGSPPLIDGLERIKNSFNSYPLDRFAQAGAIAALRDLEYFETTRKRIITSRRMLTGGLKDLGFEVLPSKANFIFASHPERDALELASELRKKKILVRHFKLPRIDQFLRITIGTDDECTLLLRALSEILGN